MADETKIRYPGFTIIVAAEDGQLHKRYVTDPEPLKRLMTRRVVQNPKSDLWFEYALDAESMHALRMLGIDPLSTDTETVTRVKRWLREHKPHLLRRPQRFYFPGN